MFVCVNRGKECPPYIRNRIKIRKLKEASRGVATSKIYSHNTKIYKEVVLKIQTHKTFLSNKHIICKKNYG